MQLLLTLLPFLTMLLMIYDATIVENDALFAVFDDAAAAVLLTAEIPHVAGVDLSTGLAKCAVLACPPVIEEAPPATQQQQRPESTAAGGSWMHGLYGQLTG